MLATIPAIFLVAMTLVVTVFKIALASGAPWGEYAYGGTKTGKLPTGFLINSVVSAFVMLAISGHYLAQL